MFPIHPSIEPTSPIPTLFPCLELRSQLLNVCILAQPIQFSLFHSMLISLHFTLPPALCYLNLGFNKALGMVLTFKISNVGLNCLLERKILAPHSSLTPDPHSQGPQQPLSSAAFDLEY